ncbi:MAG: IclR family transcriptional regulator [Kiritimatiellae bacterium]|nr:IclR family transcriptional regulator [Kiritimatiellia bacterium]MDD5521167.1 IclR family transcriptional regulator [Kiritimatiellia bacterium]
MSRKSLQKGYAVPAVDRMLDIVEYFLEHPTPVGITELARTLKIPTNSVFRILRRLADRGYAEIDAVTGGYQLGAGFFRLGMRLSTRYDLRLKARKHLEWLCQRTGETVQLHARNNGSVIVLDVVNPSVEFFMQIVVGSLLDYHCNAFGKCILAFLDDEEVGKILPPRLPARTANTITSMSKLLEDLDSIRKSGLGFDREEYMQGIFCIGAPVFDVNGKVVAGMGITGLAGRLTGDEKRHFGALVLQAAAMISKDMAYAGNLFAKWGVDIRQGTESRKEEVA